MSIENLFNKKSQVMFENKSDNKNKFLVEMNTKLCDS